MFDMQKVDRYKTDEHLQTKYKPFINLSNEDSHCARIEDSHCARIEIQ